MSGARALNGVLQPGREQSSRCAGALCDCATHYCPGCGHGLVHKLIAEAVDVLGVRERAVCVAPVGCSVLAYFYFDFDVTEAGHGRAAAVATGVKRSLPDRVVVAYQGDGDLAAIGMAETVHAANRGEKITVIFVNNTVYGMTGGQLAPTSIAGQRTTTSPDGRNVAVMGAPMKMCELLNTLELPYHIERVALDSPAGVRAARLAIRTALEAQIEAGGYAFVEILAACPVGLKLSPVESVQFISERMRSVFPVRVFRRGGQVVHD